MPRGKKELASFMGAGQVSTRDPMAQCHNLRVASLCHGDSRKRAYSSYGPALSWAGPWPMTTAT